MLLAVSTGSFMQAAAQQHRRVELLCHRTANEDVPENTLESLEQAALLGCDVVEIDIRRTLDGTIVLNHDGFLDRLSDGVGEVEETYYDDLSLRDMGGWMGDRFAGMHIALFEDALRLARDYHLRLYLDFKGKGMGADVLRLLKREGMLDQVRFGGEWEDVKPLYPGANAERETGVEPGVTVEEVKREHERGQIVIANFSANGHAMDLAGMKTAVSAGVDGINVDYPRIGADAVGRPVELRLAELAQEAITGDGIARSRAILILSHYRGFPIESEFAHWLLDEDDHVSRAAAVALVRARPRTQEAVFQSALTAQNADARANAAWALGKLETSATGLIPLLKDGDAQVIEETLVALAHMPGDVPAELLLPFLSNPTAAIRGDAALALATHQPEVAVKAIPDLLRKEVKEVLAINSDWIKRGRPPLTEDEKRTIVTYYRSGVKEVLALSMLKGRAADRALEEQAFRPGKDFAEMDGILSAFQLWDRIGADDAPLVVESLGVPDVGVADRAEWMLIKAADSVLPGVRKALASRNPEVRARAIRVLAWKGDIEALPTLKGMSQTDPADADLLAWAITKIQMLHSAP